MRLTADEGEVNLANGETEPEFSEWKWATPEEVIEQVFIHSRDSLFSQCVSTNLINFISIRQWTTRGRRTRKL